METKKLKKSSTDKKICGVCGGIAEYLNVDSTIIRLIMVIAVFISFGMAAFIYFISAFIIPEN